jgi:aerobic C4-dicarboxylate transport protein
MASGVDRFMSEARALTNLIGNGVATVVVARWEGALDTARMRQHLDREIDAEAVLVDHELDVEAAQGLAPRRSPA